jgi:HEAT repeat protein
MVELRLMMNATRNGALLLAFFMLLPCCRIAEAQKSPAEQQAESLRKELITRLASGNEEERLDALSRIGTYWRNPSNSPDSLDSTLIAALGNTLQKDPSPVVRAMAAKALEADSKNLGNEKAVSPLIDALGKERVVSVRKAIIYALAGYTQPQVTSALIPLLENKNLELRAAASFALAESGDATSIEPLTNLLRRRNKEEDSFARSQAARGLGRLGSRNSIEPLLEAMANDRSPDVRRESARALGRVASSQDVKVIEALRNAALSNDPYLVSAVDGALESLKSRKP